MMSQRSRYHRRRRYLVHRCNLRVSFKTYGDKDTQPASKVGAIGESILIVINAV